MCLRLFRYVGCSVPSEVLALGPAPDGSSSDSLLTPDHSHTTHYTFPKVPSPLSVCNQPLMSHHRCQTRLATLGGGGKPCNYVKCLNTLQSMAALLPRGTNPGLYAAKPIIKQLLSTRQYLPQHLCLSTDC